jgi:hypothetical protein
MGKGGEVKSRAETDIDSCSRSAVGEYGYGHKSRNVGFGSKNRRSDFNLRCLLSPKTDIALP